MKLSSTLFSLGAFTAFVSAQITASFDTIYDESSESLNVVACSNGVNGLESLGFTTFGSLPTFPNIGGAPAVIGFNSTGCGTCWGLTFNGTTINVTAIDVSSPSAFNIAEGALNTLTHGQAVALGRVPVTVAQLPASACGL